MLKDGCIKCGFLFISTRLSNESTRLKTLNTEDFKTRAENPAVNQRGIKLHSACANTD